MNLNVISWKSTKYGMRSTQGAISTNAKLNIDIKCKGYQQSHLHLADHAKSQVLFLQLGECSLPAAA